MSTLLPGPSARWRDTGAIHRPRAFLLAAFGCAVGLVVAGVALFQAKGTTTMLVPADAVAIVNQQPISRIDYAAQLRVLALDPLTASRAERRKVAEDMIREELFVQRGKELDVGLVDPDVRSAMVKAVEAQAAENAITNAPGDAELRAYYARHRDHYASEGTMTLRDLVFPEGLADPARQALRSGQSLPEVLTRFAGKDTGRLDGEEFYFAAKIHLGGALFAAARTLRDGQISAPLPAPDGRHVLIMISNRAPRPYDFETARKQVMSDYQAAEVAKYQQAEAAFLRKRANILLAQDIR